MKYLLLISVMTFCFTANAQTPGIAEEKTAVENALRDYIEGWYKGDTERMDRSLHNDLVKRIPLKDSSEIDITLRMVPKSRMVELTSKGGGENPDAEYEIYVDDIDKDIAAARVLSLEYLDYLHLVKTNDGWQIVNILFHVR
ncbi:nuclear transport factor 2 family protein [uncultured Eudoraea sp.]|uniref:nuclear transport factor 2 family protein n=1 Tax=uncultured Eudoraea sp. TaxID=1035614 RepID=UPI00261831E4|nr:nuclear transport factor 2 family protein [uncultured Eudoraea sp.]